MNSILEKAIKIETLEYAKKAYTLIFQESFVEFFAFLESPNNDDNYGVYSEAIMKNGLLTLRFKDKAISKEKVIEVINSENFKKEYNVAFDEATGKVVAAFAPYLSYYIEEEDKIQFIRGKLPYTFEELEAFSKNKIKLNKEIILDNGVCETVVTLESSESWI